MSIILEHVDEYENDFDDCDDNASPIVSVRLPSETSAESEQFIYEDDAASVTLTTVDKPFLFSVVSAQSERRNNECDNEEYEFDHETMPSRFADDPIQFSESEYSNDKFDAETIPHSKSIDVSIQQNCPTDIFSSPSQNTDSQAVTNVTLRPPQGPSSISSSSYDLSSIPTWILPFLALHQQLTSAYTGTDEDIRIPQTIIFCESVPIDWFCTPADAIGVFRYTKENITAKNIYDALLKRVADLSSESAILAQMVWYENEDRLCVGYLDRLDLYAILLNGTKNLPPYWILQEFIPPDLNGHVTTIVCDVECGEAVNVYSVMNKFELSQHVKQYEACMTVETSLSHGRTQRAGVTSSLRSSVTDISEVLVACLSKSVSFDFKSAIFSIMMKKTVKGRIYIMWSSPLKYISSLRNKEAVIFPTLVSESIEPTSSSEGDVSSITNANTVLLNEDNLDEVIEVVASIPFPDKTRKSKQVVRPKRAEFSVRCSLEDTLREAKQREKILKSPIAPSNPKGSSCMSSARKRVHIPFIIPQVQSIPVGIDLDKAGSIPLVIDTCVHTSKPKSPFRKRRVNFQKLKMVGVVEESLKSKSLPHKELIISKLKNQLEKKKKRRRSKESAGGCEGSMDKLIEIYNCISVSILHAFLNHLKRAAELVEPLQDSRPPIDFFTVYSRGGGLFESGFIESIIERAEMDEVTWCAEVQNLGIEHKAFISAVRIIRCVPNIREVASVTSVILWILQSASSEYINMAKSIITQSSTVCLEVRNVFREISRLQSNRSHNKEYEAILFSEIRNWHRELTQVEMELLDESIPRSKIPAPPQSSAPVVSFHRPGRKTEASLELADTSAASSSHIESYQSKRSTNDTVKIHVLLEKYFAALGWEVQLSRNKDTIDSLKRLHLSRLITQNTYTTPSTVMEKSSQIINTQIIFSYPDNFTDVQMAVAPLLTSKQRSMLFLSLFSDISHAVAIKISRFVKNSWAGKDISFDKIKEEFGEFSKYMNLEPFHHWLSMNKRSDGSFLKSSSTYIEMGLQKCVSFWPHLTVTLIEPPVLKTVVDSIPAIIDNLSLDSQKRKGLESLNNFSSSFTGDEVNRSNMVTSSDTALSAMSNRGCSTKLVWAERHTASKCFKDNTVSVFVPSFNSI